MITINTIKLKGISEKHAIAIAKMQILPISKSN